MLDDEHTQQQQQHSHKIGEKKTGLMRLWLPVCLTNIVYMSASEVHIWVDSLGRFYFSKHIAVYIDKKRQNYIWRDARQLVIVACIYV
jgi:hypothetical protein